VKGVGGTDASVVPLGNPGGGGGGGVEKGKIGGGRIQPSSCNGVNGDGKCLGGITIALLSWIVATQVTKGERGESARMNHFMKKKGKGDISNGVSSMFRGGGTRK